MLRLLVLALALAAAAALPATDFVIVGAGTAGCTIAAKLCKLLPRATLTLVERGTYRDPKARLQSQAAAYLLRAWGNPNLTRSTPSAPVAALRNRTLAVLTGANLGGGSAVNGGQIMRPPVGTFASWGIANLTEARADALYHVLEELKIDTGVPPQGVSPKYSAQWVRAAVAAGLPFTTNEFAPPRTSSVSHDTRIAFSSTGRRRDACRTFLRPYRGGVCLGRMRVLRGMVAERILFKKGKVARSVVLTRVADGSKSRLFARREILVAAGAVESAALLLRSGVGPRGELAGKTRRFVRDLPVGMRFQTRPIVAVSSLYKQPLAPINDPARLNNPQAMRDFRAGRFGVLSQSPAGAQMRLKGVGYGGMQVGFSGKALGTPLLSSYCISDVSENSFGRVRLPMHGEKLVLDGAVSPVIELGLLERKEDLERLTRCVEWMRRIHKQLDPRINGTEVLGAGQTKQSLSTTDGVVRKIRAEAGVAHQYVGTCAVGQVIDSRLRVFGLERVRVVDSAAIPRLPRSAGPMVSVYIVALQAAELIAESHRDLTLAE